MAYPYTDTGYNMFDMLSMLQKSIRRGDYEHAGFAAEQLKNSFRAAMWNRIFIISAEDCFGVVTKELVRLREQDDKEKDNQTVSNAVALLCIARKSRDACYFSCNFVLASRGPRRQEPDSEFLDIFRERMEEREHGNDALGSEYDQFGFRQLSFMSSDPFHGRSQSTITNGGEKIKAGASLQLSLMHRDMDMIGYWINVLRKDERAFLWDVLMDYSKNAASIPIMKEINALKEADTVVNQRKKEKDEIFISKAAILLCHCNDPAFESVQSCEIVHLERDIDWTAISIKPIGNCILEDGVIPEWVFDCHTLKGKSMGKTDWDMTQTEQKALYPLQPGYFDEGSWLYTYEQDLQNGYITSGQMKPILEYAQNHEVNPVEYLPYD